MIVSERDGEYAVTRFFHPDVSAVGYVPESTVSPTRWGRWEWGVE